MQKFELTSYLANPAIQGGAIFFNRSRTGTLYQRFMGTTTVDRDGVPTIIQCLVFLNATQVATLAMIPELLVGREVYVENAEFQGAAERQREDRQIDAYALTNFRVEADQEIITLKVNMVAQVQIGLSKDLNDRIDARKRAFRLAVEAGTEQSPLPAVTVGGGTTSLQTGGTFRQGAPANVNQVAQSEGRVNSNKDGQNTGNEPTDNSVSTGDAQPAATNASTGTDPHAPAERAEAGEQIPA